MKADEEMKRIGLAFGELYQVDYSFLESHISNEDTFVKYALQFRPDEDGPELNFNVIFRPEQRLKLEISLRNNVLRRQVRTGVALTPTPVAIVPENQSTRTGTWHFYRALTLLGCDEDVAALEKHLGMMSSAHERLEWLLEYEARLNALSK